MAQSFRCNATTFTRSSLKVLSTSKQYLTIVIQVSKLLSLNLGNFSRVTFSDDILAYEFTFKLLLSFFRLTVYDITSVCYKLSPPIIFLISSIKSFMKSCCLFFDSDTELATIYVSSRRSSCKHVPSTIARSCSNTNDASCSRIIVIEKKEHTQRENKEEQRGNLHTKVFTYSFPAFTYISRPMTKCQITK